MTLRLCVLLWEHPGRADDLRAFEDAVLELLPRHGGRVLSRDRVAGRQQDDPLEVQLLELPDDDALAAFLADPTRVELAEAFDRDALIARTQVLRLAAGPDG